MCSKWAFVDLRVQVAYIDTVTNCKQTKDKVFYLPTDALCISLRKNKIYIKPYIKIVPTCFGLRPTSGNLHMSLAKVMFIKLLARLICKLPDDGRRPKHVGAILIYV